jgi:hypothetical protein
MKVIRLKATVTVSIGDNDYARKYDRLHMKGSRGQEWRLIGSCNDPARSEAAVTSDNTLTDIARCLRCAHHHWITSLLCHTMPVMPAIGMRTSIPTRRRFGKSENAVYVCS